MDPTRARVKSTPACSDSTVSAPMYASISWAASCVEATSIECSTVDPDPDEEAAGVPVHPMCSLSTISYVLAQAASSSVTSPCVVGSVANTKSTAARPRKDNLSLSTFSIYISNRVNSKHAAGILPSTYTKSGNSRKRGMPHRSMESTNQGWNACIKHNFLIERRLSAAGAKVQCNRILLAVWIEADTPGRSAQLGDERSSTKRDRDAPGRAVLERVGTPTHG